MEHIAGCLIQRSSLLSHLYAVYHETSCLPVAFNSAAADIVCRVFTATNCLSDGGVIGRWFYLGLLLEFHIQMQRC